MALSADPQGEEGQARRRPSWGTRSVRLGAFALGAGVAGTAVMFVVAFAAGRGWADVAGTLFNLCLAVTALSIPLASAGIFCVIIALIKREEPLPVAGLVICIMGLAPGVSVLSMLGWFARMTGGAR